MIRLRTIGYFFAIVFLLGSNLQAEAGGFSNPIGDWYRYYSRGFGIDPNTGRMHEGIDITGFSREKPYSIEDQPAKAAKDGKVIKADWQDYYDDDGKPETPPIPATKSGGGKIVIIDHGDGTRSMYAHLKDFNVKEGDNVKQGDVIGKIDATGHTKPKGAHHLHFEIWGKDPVTGEYKKVNPFNKEKGYLNPDDYCKKLDKNCKNGQPQGPPPPPTTRPGWRPPDDTFSVADATFPTAPDLEDAYYRLAVKKGNAVVINYYTFKRLIKERDAYLENLPDGSTPDPSYLDSLETQISQLHDSFGTDYEALWKELQETPDVAVLQRGFPDGMKSLLGRFKEPVAEIDIDFSPQDVAKIHPVLIIPSGGLYGLQNSAIFKATLDEYVRLGGTMIVFTQPMGYHFSVIPTPDGKPISAYGWDEDINCFFKGAYLNQYHPIVSSLTKSMPNINIDGHFTSIPDTAVHILTRTSNGQPILAAYGHGLGRVVVTTMYTDFAYGTSQAGPDEIAIVRDMVSWAKSKDIMPEAKLGETVNVSLNIQNSTTIDASSAKLLIYNPERTQLISEQALSTSVIGGQTMVVPISYAVPLTSQPGIYHIDYLLLDSTGDAIQPQAETDSGRFIVSNPPQVGYEGQGITFTILTDAEGYIYGSTATFTIQINNHAGTEEIVTAKYEGQEKTITIAPGSAGTITYTKTAWSLSVSFYDQAATFIGSSYRMPSLYWPSAGIKATTDKTLYAKNETVAINTSLKNNVPAGWQSNVKITITDPKNTKVFEDTKVISLSSYGTITIATSFTLPATLSIGTYTVRAEVWYGTRLVSSASTSFELPQSQISVALNLPILTAGTNAIPFTITNTGKISVSSGTLDVSFKDPEGNIIYTGSQPFALTPGQSITIDIPVNIPSQKFGNYTLTYTQSDETKTGGTATITIPNTVTVALAFDKPSYRIRETANLTVDLTNTGKFNLDNGAVIVTVPDAGYTDTKTVNIGQGQAQPLQYAIQIPDTILAGQHDVNVTLTLPSGSSTVQTAKLVIPESSLTIGYSGPTTLTAGDMINLTIENIGGVDGGYNSYIYLMDKLGNGIDSKTGSGLVMAGGQTFLPYILPDQLQSGRYLLEIDLLDNKTNRLILYQVFSMEVSGLKVVLSVKTDKDVYFTTEATTALSTIINQDRPINNGNLHLEIVCANPTQSFHISTEEGGLLVERGILRFPPAFTLKELPLPISPDQWGSAYVRFIQEGASGALIDYLALRDSNGNVYSPWFVGIPEWKDYTADVQTQDGLAADVTDQGFDAWWEGLPPGASFTLVMVAREETGCGLLWQNDTVINQGAGATQDVSIPTGILGQAGKFYLRGSLTNLFGQTIAASEYPFYIIEGDTVLLLNTGKKVYKPGETVTITGEVKNLATVSLDNAVFFLNAGTTTLINQTITVPAGGSYPFTVTTTTGSEGVVSLTGKVSQNNSTLVEITDSFEVAKPTLTASINAPDIVGRPPFDLVIELKNTGKVDTVIQLQVTGGLLSDVSQLTIPAGETRLLQYAQSIIQNITYSLSITGDVTTTLSKQIIYGEVAQITFNAATGVYPEGSAAIPVTITNTGLIDETIDARFKIQDAGGSIIKEMIKSYYLTKGGIITDTLYFDLTEGSYQLSAVSGQPSATATANFAVGKENKVDMTVTVAGQTNGLIPVTVNLANNGWNTIEGSVQVSVVNAQGVIVWSGEAQVTGLISQGSSSYTININPDIITPGDYTLKAGLLNNSGQQLAVSSQPLTIKGAVFQITQLPAYSTFTAGIEGSFIFTVKNTGNQEGEMSFTVKAMDVLDQTVVDWLRPGEEKTITFNFLLPDDVEEKDYFAEYALISGDSPYSTTSSVNRDSPLRGQVKYHVAGINLMVNAALDKQNYNVGETARLTITVSSQQSAAGSINLFGRVNYAGYESNQPFTLNGSQSLAFDIPLTEITGEKLFYGIYHESGRSIHLNSLYIYKAGDGITITTDKQVYNPGETVSVTVNSISGATGTMTLAGPGGYTETFNFAGSATKGFALPATMTAGTYHISYQMTDVSGQTFSGSHAIDINGIQVKVKEATLGKIKYAATDIINLSLAIESNQNLSATLKTWIVDPEGNYTLAGEQGISLSSSDPLLVTGHSSLATASMGIHRLVYGIYSGDLLLSSGSEAFDVGDAVLLGIATDKADYPNGSEAVNIATSLYGTVSGTLEFFIDGASVGRDTVTLAGFSTHSRQLANIEPGPHILKTVLTAGGLSSSKEANFVYGSNLPDLVVSSIDAKRDRSTYIITVAIANQGKTPSGPSEITLYDGIGAIATLSVPTLAPGVITTISYNWNALGRAGGHTLYASVDPANSVREFNEKNNTASVNITVPEFTLDASATRSEYRANEDVGVVIDIANLTSDSAYTNLKIDARIKGPAGNVIVNKANDIQTLPPAFTTSYGFVWNTGSAPPGIYTITGTLNNPAAGITLTQGSADFTIIPTPSIIGTLTLSKDRIIQGFDLKADYTLTNNGNIDLGGGDVRLEFISAGIGVAVTSHMQTFGFLQVLKAASNIFSIDKLDIEPGDYTVRLTAITEGTSFIIGEKPLKVLPPLEVTKGISLAPRALVLLDKKDEHDDEKGQGSSLPLQAISRGGKGQGDLNQAIIIEALNSIGAYYQIVRDKASFKNAMRSSIYNTYILAGKEPLEDHLDEELKERINSGEALILMNYKNIEDEKFKDVTGVKGEGSLEKKQRKLNIIENPIIQPGALTIAGKVDRLKVTGDEAAVIGTVTEKGKTYPVILFNTYGEGSTILFAFDSGESAKAYGSTVPYSNLLSNAITYMAPKKINPLPGYPIGVEIGIKSLGPAFDLKVKEAIGTKGVILTYPSGKVDEAGITWELRLSGGGKETLHYLTKIDDTGGAYTNTTTVEYLKDRAYKTFDTYSLSITAEDIGDIKMRILHSLEGLSSNEDTREIIEKYNEFLNRPIVDRKDIEESIKDILDVIEDLEEYAEDEPGLKETISALRLDLDGLLKILGRKWAEGLPAGEEEGE